jgi:hypothetical protein
MTHLENDPVAALTAAALAIVNPGSESLSAQAMPGRCGQEMTQQEITLRLAMEWLNDSLNYRGAIDSPLFANV